MTNDKSIKCGKCNSQYDPRPKLNSEELDYSCPLCGFGKFRETYEYTAPVKKSILCD